MPGRPRQLTASGGGPGSDTTAIHQGGDAYSADITIGTTDTYELKIKVDAVTVWMFDVFGDLIPAVAGLTIGDFTTPVGEISSGVFNAVNPSDAYQGVQITPTGVYFSNTLAPVDMNLQRKANGELQAVTPSGTYDLTPPASAVTDATISTSDVTTNNVTSSKHGWAPKSLADATKFLNSATAPTYAQVKDADLAFTDVTTNNATVSAHGYVPKLPNDATKFYDGTGAYSIPAGAGTNIGCRLTHSVDQTIGSATYTVLAFDTEIYDNGGLHSTTTNNSYINILTTGVYLFTAGACLSLGGTVRELGLRVNGTYYQVFVDFATANADFECVGTLLSLTAGDYVQVLAYASTGATVYTTATVGAAGVNTPVFCCQKLDKAG